MANNPQDLLGKLYKLTPRERQVLECRCRGWDYGTIAKHLVVTKKAIKTYMDRIYNKLELKGYGRAARTKLLYEEYCPLLQQMEKTSRELVLVGREATPEQEDQEAEKAPIPPEDEKTLDDDEYSIVLVRPAPLRASKPEAKPRRWGLRGLVVGVILGLCAGAVGAYLVLQRSKGQLPLLPQPTATVPPPMVRASDTPLPSPTAEVPTQTAVVIQQIVVVTATPLPAAQVPTAPPVPAIGLPFADSFDSGADARWSMLYGTWITANGKFTTVEQGTQESWYWAVLDGSDWQNYRVSVDIHIPYAYAASEGSAAILVRRADSQNKYLGFYINTLMRGGWALIGNHWNDEQYIAGEGSSLPDSGTFELEANGSSFTVRVNGQVYQQITISGYDQGGVGLGVLCEADKCPSFDNLKVQQLGP